MASKMHKAEQAKLVRNYHATASVTDDAIFQFLSALDCPKSLAIWLLYSNKEHQQLVDIDIEPEDFVCPLAFRDAYSAWAFLSKANFFKLDVSKKDAAYKKFFQYEELCKQTNGRFRNLALDPNYHGSNASLFHTMERKIAEILGDFDPDEIVEMADWGPGVTTLLKGEHVSAINKFHSENGITRDLYSLIGPVFQEAYPLWGAHLSEKFGENWANYQVGNFIVTVPKNSKTDRVIASEPGINLWFQKAIGKMIRRRLLRWGIDLNDQTKNQLLSKVASLTGELTTVDFSSASDSIAKLLVREAFPSRWFALLNSCRCTFGTHDTTLIRWEKFSSMGNGFTFELESLIFFAAALAVKDHLEVEGQISVYGDDVILPTQCYELFSSFSEFLGFRVNRDKTYSRGYFRESCGAHWFDGVDCKPIFLKEKVRNVQGVFKLANSVRWLAHRHNSYYGCDSRFLDTWTHLFRRIPKPVRLRIPVGLGDGGFIGNFDEATPSRASRGIEGYYVDALLETGVSQDFDGQAVLLARLWQQSSQAHWITSKLRGRHLARKVAYAYRNLGADDVEYGNSYTLRGRVKTRISRVLVQQWYDLGPWL